MPSDSADLTFDHARWTSVARRHWAMIAVSAALGLAAGLFFAGSSEPGYLASADVRLARDLSPGTANPQTSARGAANEMAILTSPQLLSETEAALGDDVKLRATLLEGSDVARVTATSASRDLAERAASTLVAGYVEQRTTVQESQMDAVRELLTARLTEVGTALTDASAEGERALLAERTELRARLATLDETQALSSADPLVLSEPTSQIAGPALATMGLVGLGVGTLLGCVLALLRDRTGARAKGVDGEVPAIPGTALNDRDGPWDTLSVHDQKRYIAAVGHLLAAHDGRGALTTALTAAELDVPIFRLAVRLAEALRNCGYRPLVVDLSGSSRTEVASVPVRLVKDLHLLPKEAQQAQLLGVMTTDDVTVLDLALLEGAQQVDVVRRLIAESHPDDVYILLAGPADSAHAVRAARLPVRAALVARKGATRLRALRSAAACLAEMDVPVAATLVVHRSRAASRRAAAAAPARTGREAVPDARVSR